MPGASQAGARPAFAAPIAGGGTGAPECAASHSTHSGHHEPARTGVSATQLSGST